MDVYFRVGAAYKGATVEVYSGGEKIFSRKKQIMTPGEMEKITLKASALEDAAGPVSVSLEVLE